MASEIFSKITIKPKLICIAKKVFEFLFTFSGYKNVRSQNNIPETLLGQKGLLG